MRRTRPRPSAGESGAKRARADRAPPAFTPVPRGAALSINTLPVELLPLIFDYIPFVPRMRCISLVCKRWRTSVLRSVHTLRAAHMDRFLVEEEEEEVHKPCEYRRAINLFPFLSDIQLCPCPADPNPIALPSTLRHLSLFSRGPEDEDEDEVTSTFRFVGPIPALSALELDAMAEDGEVIVPFLAASVETLTSLHLGVGNTLSERLAQLLGTTHFPALTSAMLQPPEVKAKSVASKHITAFLERHAPQLTSLTLRTINFQDNTRTDFFVAILTLQYTALTRLDIDVYELTGEQLTMLLMHCPRLTHLDLCNPEPLAHVKPVTLLTSVRAIYLDAMSEEHFSLETIGLCPNLTSLGGLSVEDQCFDLKDLLDAGYATLLESLHLKSIEDMAVGQRALATCTNLSELNFTEVKAHWMPMPTEALPKLRSLFFTQCRLRWDDTRRYLRKYLQKCPRLREVRFELAREDMTAEVVAQVRELAAEMLRKGVSFLAIGYTTMKEELAAALAFTKPHGWLEVTLQPRREAEEGEKEARDPDDSSASTV